MAHSLLKAGVATHHGICCWVCEGRPGMSDQHVAWDGEVLPQDHVFVRPPRFPFFPVDPVDADCPAYEQPRLAIDFQAGVIGHEFEIWEHSVSVENVGVGMIAADTEVFDAEVRETVVEPLGGGVIPP